MIEYYPTMSNDGVDLPQRNRETKPQTAPRLSDDELYRALSARRRRRLLYLLLVEDVATIDKIATVLAGWDATETGTMVTPDERTEIMLELRHVHLPRLAEAGFVAVDSDDDTVELLPLDDAVVDLICQSVESEDEARS